VADSEWLRERVNLAIDKSLNLKFQIRDFKRQMALAASGHLSNYRIAGGLVRAAEALATRNW
jgi:hypothetical protein